MPTRRLLSYGGPACPHCQRALDLERVASGWQHCPACARRFEAVRFTPLARAPSVREVGASGPGEAASCAAHRRNAAVASCGRCGIFMCGLCRTEADGLTLCAPCFERLAAEGTLHSAQTRYRDYVGLSWLASVSGVLLCTSGLLLGPLAVYYGLKALRQMNEWGDVGGRARAVTAMFAGMASFAWSGVVVASLFINK